jgi:hypothetical protein
MIRSYSELAKLKTFEERFKYLKLSGTVGKDTFGYERYLNQVFYRSNAWKKIRRDVIIRDQACDLGILDRSITGKVFVHHMNPILPKDLDDGDLSNLMNPEFLICVSLNTHNAIHYGDEHLLIPTEIIERKPGDTCPWRI